jgi:hypothetical protein
MSEPRIQLWTDDANAEFAIFLKPKFVIKTNHDANYTKIIDESPCMQGYTYDWKHTLTHWVNYCFGNGVLVNISDDYPVDNQESLIQTQAEPKVKAVRYHNIMHAKTSISHMESKTKLRSDLLKCHFCNLKYAMEVERKEHEKFWHSNKLVTK